MMQNFILWQKQQQIVLLHQEAWSVVMPKITNNQLYQTRLGRKKGKLKIDRVSTISIIYGKICLYATSENLFVGL